jgi:hypothetical protein
MAGLIVGADPRVRNAFRATLRDEPSTASLISTAELDPADVLEVGDLARAIARAEQVIRERASAPRLSTPAAPSSSGTRDIFDALVTDDCIGPALHAPYIPTPIPPPPTPALARNRASTIPPPPPNGTLRLPELHVPPAPRTAPLLVIDERAFYHFAHSAGTFQDHAPARSPWACLGERKVLLWVAVAVITPLMLLSLFVVGVQLGRARAAREASIPATMAAPRTTAEVPTAPAATVPRPKAAAQPTAAPTAESPGVPVLDVRSLKSAPPPNRSKSAQTQR